MHRSNSVYRCYSALAAHIRLSLSEPYLLCANAFFGSLAANGRIFHLRTLAHSLGDSCAEKEYFLALVDLGQAAFIRVMGIDQPWNGSESQGQHFANTLRNELLHIISLQRYVSFQFVRKPSKFLPRSYSDVSVTSVGKASIAFAKAFDLIRSLPEHNHPVNERSSVCIA